MDMLFAASRMLDVQDKSCGELWKKIEVVESCGRLWKIIEVVAIQESGAI